jgi:hypothetical protein
MKLRQQHLRARRWHLSGFCFTQIIFIITRHLQENKLKCKNGSRIEARRAIAAVEITVRAARRAAAA